MASDHRYYSRRAAEEQRRALWQNFERAYEKQHALDEERLARNGSEVASDE